MQHYIIKNHAAVNDEYYFGQYGIAPFTREHPKDAYWFKSKKVALEVCSLLNTNNSAAKWLVEDLIKE